MSGYSKLRLSTRIYFQQAILAIALIGVTLTAFYYSQAFVKEVQVIQDVNTPMAKGIALATAERLRQNRDFERVLRYGPKLNEGEHWQKLFDKVVGKVRGHVGELKKGVAETELNLPLAMEHARKNGDTEGQAMIADLTGRMQAMSEEEANFMATVEDVISDFKAGRAAEGSRKGEIIEDAISANNDKLEELNDLANTVLALPVGQATALAVEMKANMVILAAIATAVALTMMILTGIAMNSLSKAMSNIGNSVQQVATAASQSSKAIGVVSDGSRQQSVAIGQAVTAVGQSAAVLNDVSRNAESATHLSRQTATAVLDGRSQVARMSEIVGRISDNSNKINRITDVINNIANQTNMLSLNAAIEAARAGEHGKGFAVVAEQVRKLAESSRAAVQDIMELAQQAIRDAGEAVGASEQVNQEIGKISRAAAETERTMQSISTSMTQQVATAEELQQNMDTLKGIGDNNANAAEEITQTILEMNELLSHISTETNTEVRRFNI